MSVEDLFCRFKRVIEFMKEEGKNPDTRWNVLELSTVCAAMFSSVVGAPPELHVPNVFALQLLILLSSGFRCRYNLRRHFNIVLHTTSWVSSLFYICSAHIRCADKPHRYSRYMTLKYSKTELCNTCNTNNFEVCRF